jgi:hypothetical protein
MSGLDTSRREEIITGMVYKAIDANGEVDKEDT